MMTPDPTDDLIVRMLRRRAEGDVPGWIRTSTMARAGTTPQHRGGLGSRLTLPARGPARVGMILAAALALLALAVGGALAARLLVLSAGPSLPAEVVLPSPSLQASSPGTTPPAAGARPSAGPPGGSSAAVASAWRLPEGWRYDLQCQDSEDGPGSCLLHLFDAGGSEQEGWPVAIDGTCWYGATVGPDNSAFVPCQRGRGALLAGFDQHGRPLPGWPVTLQGELMSQAQIDSHGTVYVGVESPRGSRYQIHALVQDGSAQAGAWPKTLPGGAGGFELAPRDTIVAWWYEGIAEDTIDFQARRTVFTMFNAKGTTLPGWPNGSTGAATAPVVWRDGSIFYTSASAKVWGLDRSGHRIKGWPFQLASVVQPEFRTDGKLVLVGDSRVDVLTRSGKQVAGWPYRSKASFLAPGCDTPSFPQPVSALASDDRVYVGSWDGERASVIALEPDGSVADGWPYLVPPGWTVGMLELESDGNVLLSLDGAWCGAGHATARLSPSGDVVGEPPPMSPTEVYERLKLDGVRTSSGATAFTRGEQIGIDGALVNRSDETVALPPVPYSDQEAYGAGAIQVWVEPLDMSDLGACLPDADWNDARYLVGELGVSTKAPLSLEPGASVLWTQPGLLTTDLTSCLPIGQYRLRVVYTSPDGGGEEAYDEEWIDVVLEDPAVVTAPPTPTWSPTPMGSATLTASPHPAPTTSPAPTQGIPARSPVASESPTPSDAPEGSPGG